MENLSLVLLIFSPVIMSLLLFLPVFRDSDKITRRFAKFFTGIHFAYAMMFWVFYNPDVNYFDELTLFGQSGIQSLGIRSAFAMDGLSLIFVILTSFLVFMAAIASKRQISGKYSLYYGLLFLLETSILGVFTSADMYLFFLFWELELIPMYFLISLWGSGNAKKSAMKFLLYTFFGSLFLLIGILFLNHYSDTLNYQVSSMFADINVIDKVPVKIQLLISVLMLIGFLVKIPLIPFHTWLPDAHCDAPSPVSMLLAGVMLKMGAYGIIRFNILLLPDAFKIIAPVLIIMAIINIVHAGLVAYNQNDLKKIIAYSSISNMGIVVLGLCSGNSVGSIGGIFHMVSHGLICAGLFFIVGIIYHRTKTRDLAVLGGLGGIMPNLMAISVVFSLSAVGVPLLMGFVGEFLTFWGALNAQYETVIVIPVVVIVAMLVLILSIAYMLKFLHKTFFGAMHEGWNNLRDISTHEFIVLASILSFVIFFGIQPMILIDVIKPVAEIITESVGL